MPEVPLRYRFGLYEADVRAGELRRDGIRIKLQDQPFQVLVALLERPNDLVTREELRLRLWPADTFVDFDHSLNTAINKLREALGDSASNPRFIETKARKGYRFIAPVQAIAGSNGALAAESPTAELAAIPADVPQVRVPSSEANLGTLSAPDDHELPRPHRGLTRTLFALIQVLYLCFYVVGLSRLSDVSTIAESLLPGQGWAIMMLVLVSAVVGIPVRLYLLMAVSFDYRLLGQSFMRIFLPLVILDEVWALSPFLLHDHIGVGLSFAATAALLYLPFSQRTLIRMSYSVQK